MTAIPVASFLEGALLSLLLPTIMLILLVVWYWKSIHHGPKATGELRKSHPDPEPQVDAPSAGSGTGSNP